MKRLEILGIFGSLLSEHTFDPSDKLTAFRFEPPLQAKITEIIIREEKKEQKEEGG